MLATMALVIVGLMGIGMIGAGLVLLHHLLKRKEEQAKVEALRTTVFPELEKMTMNMMAKTMDVVYEKTIDMTKKMTESMYND